jgi:hypothetical protein
VTVRTGEIEIVGREAELGGVREFLDAFDRLPAAVVVEGEAGVGKTTLWRSAVVSAMELGYRFLSTRPAETESQVSYGGLADAGSPSVERRVTGVAERAVARSVGVRSSLRLAPC